MIKVLSRAFATDPLYRSILGERSGSERELMAWMKPIVGYGLKFGIVDAVVDASDEKSEAAGVAIWLGPDRPHVSTWQMVRCGMGRLIYLWPLLRILRAAWATRDFAKLQARHAPGRHFYLMIVGLDPERQHRGLGSRLLAPVLARSDREGLPCYLETTNESNLGFYRKLGFELQSQHGVGSGEHAFTLYCLVRLPKPARL